MARRIIDRISQGQVDAALSALADGLAALAAPAISPYELGRLLFVSFANKDSSPCASPLKQVYQTSIRALVQVRLLSPIRSSQSSVLGYRLFGRKSASPAEIACSLDPFAYVSHLSAMEYHGLTDHLPLTLFMCRPPPGEWRTQAAARIHKDLAGDVERYKASGLPRLTRPSLSGIDRTVIHFHDRSQMGAFRRIAGSPLCVTTVGRTFLDMLREPSLCGGMQHVLDAYRDNASRYVDLIVDEIDLHGAPIDKVRAGYMLTEICRLALPAADRWRAFAQRGGSRKLDQDAEYAATYSENWKLSLNVPQLEAADDHVHAE